MFNLPNLWATGPADRLSSATSISIKRPIGRELDYLKDVALLFDLCLNRSSKLRLPTSIKKSGFNVHGDLTYRTERRKRVHVRRPHLWHFNLVISYEN
jgi:hypothetical protein